MVEQIVRGRCLCGDIRYEYRGGPVATLHCHCESCRRHTSSPVATFVCVAKASFRFLSGTPTVYASSPGVRRMHCARCGSLLYSRVRDGKWVHVAMGTLVDAPSIRPTAHIFVGSKAAWHEITDNLPQYRGHIGAT